MNVCRLCLNHSVEEHVELSYGSPIAREMLKECVPELKDIHLLKAKLCCPCYEKLSNAYEFRTKCLSSLQIINDITNHDSQVETNIDAYFLSFQCKTEDSRNITVISDDEDNQVKREPIDNESNALNSINYALEASDQNAVLRIDNMNTVNIRPRRKAANLTPNENVSDYQSQMVQPTTAKISSENTLVYGDQQRACIPKTSTLKRKRKIKSMPPLVNGPNQKLNSAPLKKTAPEFAKYQLANVLPPTNEITITEINKMCSEKYVCEICYRQYTNRACLYKHLKTTHNICKTVPSSIYETRRIKRLMQTITQQEIQKIKLELTTPCATAMCYTCNISLGCMHELKFHNAIHHWGLPMENVHFIIYCNRCNQRFSHKYIREHLYSHNCVVELEDIFKEVEVPQEGTFIIVKFWKCDICEKFFNTSKESIQHHYDSHREFLTEVVQ